MNQEKNKFATAPLLGNNRTLDETFTIGSHEVGGPQRLPQLVLGLHGNHGIQIFYR